MKVLVIGGGGREHALAWKLAQSPRVQCVYVAPGNGGTARDARTCTTWASPISPRWPTSLPPRRWDSPWWAPRRRCRLAWWTCSARAGLRIFGPTQAAAQLESSKAFAKDFMQRHAIPTAAVRHVHRRGRRRTRTWTAWARPIVVKADGLAAGKGVVVATTPAEAHEAIDFMLLDNKLGVQHNAGGARVVIEEFMQGEEASFIVLCDGTHVLALATSQDHKRIGDGDTGPQHRRHGRVFAGAGGHAQRACAGDAATSSMPTVAGHGQGRHALHRLPLCRADDRCPGPASHGGVQRAPGRPRGRSRS